MSEQRMSRTLTAACWLALTTFIILIISFSTPCWLETDGRMSNAKFIRLGLWEVCFNRFEDPFYRYDRVFTGCRWIFDEEFHFIDDILRPPFFTATQIFFTYSFTIGLLACIGVLIFNFFCPPDREIVALRIIGCALLTGGISGMISVIVFGALGDSRDFMPHWQNNNLSWSYAFGVIGCILQDINGILFLIEARRLAKRLETNASGKKDPSSVYTLK